MRAIIFIGIVLGLAYVFLLQQQEVEKFDLDEAENKLEQIETDVEKAIDQAQENLEKTLENNK